MYTTCLPQSSFSSLFDTVCETETQCYPATKHVVRVSAATSVEFMLFTHLGLFCLFLFSTADSAVKLLLYLCCQREERPDPKHRVSTSVNGWPSEKVCLHFPSSAHQLLHGFACCGIYGHSNTHRCEETSSSPGVSNSIGEGIIEEEEEEEAEEESNKKRMKEDDQEVYFISLSLSCSIYVNLWVDLKKVDFRQYR